jgi:hypothetical protein
VPTHPPSFRFAALLALSLIGCALGCSSGGSTNPGGIIAPTQPTPSSGNFTLSLSSSSLTVPQGGSIGRVTVSVARTSTTGSVTLSVTGLPSGTAATFDQQPGTGASGTVALNPLQAAAGTYSLTVSATDGTSTATAPLSWTIGPGTTSKLSSPIAWSSTGPLISAIPDATHPIVSVKDPTVFYYNNQWNVYATTADTNGNWSMAYFHFPDWSSASSAKPYYMDENPALTGYHAAPEVFYFAPQKTWYMIFQSGQPQYSTTSDPTQPSTWSVPQNFFPSQPASVSAWIDFHVICDSNNCYLFFSGDNGIVYRSHTPIADFPNGFSEPEPILQATNKFDLFESGKVYALQGLNQYLLIEEAIGPTGHRYFRSYIATDLGGSFTPIPSANSWQNPFAGINNVTFPNGQWTDDISHGGMIRVGYDQTLTIDPNHLQFLYQGVDPSKTSVSYVETPYQLALLTRTN